jgi:hypothetical protein
MDEVRIVRRHTHVWPVVIALVGLALVIAYAFFTMNSTASLDIGWLGHLERVIRA